MPGGDRTGPNGLGPMTGRRMGYCSGYNNPGYANPGPRRFFGRGFGRGFGWRRWNMPVERVAPVQNIPIYPEPTQPQQPTKEQELAMLKDDANSIEAEQKALNQESEAIKKRITELESKQQ